MSDIFTPGKRSEIMSRIRSTETKPEIVVRKALFALGYRYRKNVKNLPGRPDIVLPKYKTAIFVNGCFWHGHENCKNARTPKGNVEYWKPKLEYNKERDKQNNKELEHLGWRVITVWECDVEANLEEVMHELIKLLPKS